MAARHHRQTATYWPVTGSDGFGGYTVDPPKVLNVRWEDRQDVFTDENGEQFVSRSIVYMSQEVDLGDFIVEGDHSDETDPTQVNGALRVKQTMRVSNLRNVSVEHKVVL